MSPWILWTTAALAGAPTVRASGVSSARAVAVLLQRGDEVAGAPCNDAGAPPDAGADGIYTCGPLPPVAGAVRVGLLRDGRLLDAGEATLGADGLVVRVDGGAVVLGDDPSLLARPISGPPAPAATTLFARVRGVGDGPAPVLRLQGPGGSAELVCRDDGVFPDAARNDGEHGCAGPAPGTPGAAGRADVFVNGVGAGSMGAVTWDAAAPFAFVVVDVQARAARAEPFALPGFAPAPVVTHQDLGEPAPASPTEPVPVGEGPPPPEPVDPEPPTPPDVSPPRPPDEAPSHSPVATREVGLGVSPLALLAALTLGVGGGWAWGRRAGRVPASLRVEPAPALLPGGPSLADGACALRCADPVALAAALLPVLARHRRVVVVAAPDVALPATADGPVYRAGSADCEEIEAAVRSLARTPGPTVAVLVVGDVLRDTGAVAPAPARKLRDGLPAGVWLGVLAADAPAGFPVWDVRGPPFSAARPDAERPDPAPEAPVGEA